jgi:hypothetical protein
MRENNLALKIVCHCYSDYGGCEFLGEEGAVKADMKSTTRYVVKLENCLVFFKIKKQWVFARSSTEAEILAASTAVNDLQFLYNVLHDLLSNLQKTSITSKLMIDNANAARAFQHGSLGSRTRHIAIHMATIVDLKSKLTMALV